MHSLLVIAYTVMFGSTVPSVVATVVIGVDYNGNENGTSSTISISFHTAACLLCCIFNGTYKCHLHKLSCLVAWIYGQNPCTKGYTNINPYGQHPCGITFRLNNNYQYYLADCNGPGNPVLYNSDGSFNSACNHIPTYKTGCANMEQVLTC